MRIIGGEHRGRKIEQPGSGATRPTKDRIREAVFNMIAEKVPGARVLDIFAGSGAYGLEALSRGASGAFFIEKDAEAVRIISENIAVLGVGDRAKVIAEEASVALETVKNEEGFDLVFSDPPYGQGMSKNILIMINQYDIVIPSGFVIIEHHMSESLPGTEGSLSICKQKTYGDIRISVFSKK
jgi:16S rRNA (guanine966-N2)-methyltransferase